MHPSPTPEWHSNLVLICEKCGKKLDRKVSPSSQLKDTLKKALIQRELWGETRVLMTSCMDICPEGELAVTLLSDRPGSKVEALTIGPDADPLPLLKRIVDRAKS